MGVEEGGGIQLQGFGKLEEKGDRWNDLTILNPFQILVRAADLVGQFLDAEASFLAGQLDSLANRFGFVHDHFLMSFQ
jgi:hypothetical protein